MEPSTAAKMVDEFVEKARQLGIEVATGQFGANMNVSLTNQGPVTIIIDSKN
jgi:D-tyrosyl-tRNA(Tyr) deacylase